MLNVQKIDHVGIRVRQRDRAVAFYEQLGFVLIAEGVFEKGHPVIMEHPCGVVLNVLGPANTPEGHNVLMDQEEVRPAGYTHMALRVESLEETEAFFQEHGIELTGRFEYQDVRAVFIRDPDRNVIEFDAYPGQDPSTRSGGGGYADHP